MEMGLLPKVDVISNLPENLIEAILVLLPIRDAVRTSILSRQWRNKWTTIPQLVFNEKCVPPPSGNIELDQFKCVNIINQVLLRHSGPILKFECSSYLKSCPYIDQWILFLSNHGIKEFTLNCLKGELYKVPSCLFSCQHMTYLKLTNCIFTPSPTFSGFRHLTSVYLENTYNYNYENLLSNCPLLESLSLEIYCPTPKQLKIFGPNLRNVVIFIFGNFDSIYFEDTPLLNIVGISMDRFIENATGQTEQDDSCNRVKVLSCLYNVQTLVMHGQFLQFLAIGNLPERLPTSYGRLRFLFLHMSFNALKEISAIICLFRSSPNLEILTIKAHLKRGTDDMHEAQKIYGNAQQGFLTRLRKVWMTEITGTKLELEFVKFILANAPLLCWIVIRITKKTDAEESRIVKELIQLPRASAQARIYIR